MLTEAALNREAAVTGFQPEPLEKAVRLLGLLDGLRSHPYLKPRIALKGGTALNLFVFDVPRLSVDIDRIAEWTRELVEDCRELLSMVLPLDRQEREFLDALNDRGEILPEILTADPTLGDRIRSHPGLLWKAHNVRRHRGLDDGGPDDATADRNHS